MGNHSEALVLEQSPVLRGIEAGVIQRLTCKASDRLTVLRSAREDQRSAWRGVRPEYREHSPLIFVAQVEEAVPRKDALKLLFKDSVRMSETIAG